MTRSPPEERGFPETLNLRGAKRPQGLKAPGINWCIKMELVSYHEKVEILIKALAKRYQNIDMPVEDLMQEGRIAAFRAIPQWQKSNGNAKAIAWAWVYIWARYRELSSSKQSQPEVSYEDRQDQENINATDLYLDRYFANDADDTTEEGDISHVDIETKKSMFSFLKSALSNGYSDLAQKSDKTISRRQIAAREHVTVQRINQLTRKIENHLNIKRESENHGRKKEKILPEL